MKTTRIRVAFAKFGRDIAVIILGVLIALAFDNWGTSRSERRLERNYLARLARDLRADSVVLDRYQHHAVAGEAGGQRLLTLLTDPNDVIADSLIARHFSDATRGALLSANTPTIEELTSTGNLRVLRDVQLRDKLLFYYAEVARFQRSIETIMRRGRDPLAEVGWDVRAFDLSLSYAITREPTDGAMRALESDPEGSGALIRRFRQHPDALRSTRRAITYHSLMRPIIADWTSQLEAVRSQLNHH